MRDTVGATLNAALVNDIMNHKVLTVKQLKNVLFYMKMLGLITKGTYDKVEETFHHRNRYVIAQYANGVNLYSFNEPKNEKNVENVGFLCEDTEVEVYDTFNPVEYAEWVIEQLYEDCNLRKIIIFDSFKGLISELSKYKIPTWYMFSADEFVSSVRNAMLIDGELFYLYKTEHFTYELHYQNMQKNRLMWSLKDGIVIKKGLSQRCFYVKNDGAEYIYCGIEKTDSFFRFDLKRWTASIVKDILFLGVNGKGQEVLVLQKKKICVLVGSEVRVLHEYSSNMHYSVLPDYVLAWHDNVYGDACRPECYSYEGVVKKSDAKNSACVFWKRLLDTQTKVSTLHYSGCISDLLMFYKVTKAPDVLTIHSLMKCYTEVAELGLVYKERYFPFYNLLKLLEKKGIDPHEDITDMLYTLIKYSILCMKHDWGYLFHKNFYFLLRRLSKRDDFLELLKNEPDILFMETVCVTREIIDKRRQKYFLPGYIYYWRGLIGTFDVLNDNIVYDMKQTDQGTIIDNTICYKGKNDYRGKVYYNLITGKYVLYWINRDIALAEAVQKLFFHETDNLVFEFGGEEH